MRQYDTLKPYKKPYIYLTCLLLGYAWEYHCVSIICHDLKPFARTKLKFDAQRRFDQVAMEIIADNIQQFFGESHLLYQSKKMICLTL